jgi:hypothetical protein
VHNLLRLSFQGAVHGTLLVVVIVVVVSSSRKEPHVPSASIIPGV